MAELVKTDALVLRKLDYGDTSKIATLFSPDYGKLSVIVKGGRSSKSKIGAVVDLLNHVGIVYSNKNTREIQIVTQADLIDNFSKIKEDLEKLKYATAILELLNSLTVAEHSYDRLFRGVIKILTLLNITENDPKLLFVKFFIFFVEEIGYEFQFENCTFCGKELKGNEAVRYNYEFGMMCLDCSKDRLFSFEFSSELFKSLLCLSERENESVIKTDHIEKLILFLERYLMYHIDEFKGLKSLQIL